jgi:hypothetical protein
VSVWRIGIRLGSRIDLLAHHHEGDHVHPRASGGPEGSHRQGVPHRRGEAVGGEHHLPGERFDENRSTVATFTPSRYMAAVPRALLLGATHATLLPVKESLEVVPLAVANESVPPKAERRFWVCQVPAG